MAVKAGTAYVDIEPRFTDFASKVNKNVQQVTKVNANALKVAGAVAAGVAIKAASAFVDWGSSAKKLSRELGVSAESASRLAFTGRQLGLDSDQLSLAFGNLSKKMHTNDEVFKTLGVTVRDTGGKLLPFEQVLGSLAQRFKTLPDGPEKTALALALFGKQGKSLIPLLNQGAAGLEKFAKQSDKLGFTLSGAGLQAVTDYKKAQKELSATLKGFEIQIGSKTAPALTFFNGILKELSGLVAKIPAPIAAAGLGITTLVGGAVTFADGLVKLSEGGAAAVKLLSKIGILKKFSALANVAEATSAGVATTANIALTGSLVPLAVAQGTAAAAARAHDKALAGLASRAVLARGALGLAGKVLAKASLVVAAGWSIAQGVLGRLRKGTNGLTDSIEQGSASTEEMDKVFGNLSRGTGRLLQDSLSKSAERLAKFANSADGLKNIGDTARKQISGLLGAAASTKDLGDDARNLNESWRIAREAMDAGAASAMGLGTAVGAAETKIHQFAGMTESSLTDWRTSNVQNMNFVKGSLGELANQADLSARKVLEGFRKQLEAQVKYRANFESLVRRGLPQDFAKQIADMGSQGAILVAALAKTNGKEFKEIVDTWAVAGQEARGLTGFIAGIGGAIAKIPAAVHMDFTARISKIEREQNKNMPGLAGGGIIRHSPGGTVIRAGEGRWDEAVVPLTGNHGMGSVTVVVQGNVTTERELLEAIRKGLQQTARRNGGN